MSSACRYCDQLLTGPTAREPWNYVIAETDDFVVVPTLGSLVPGWLLVVSRDHVLCAGALDITAHSRLSRAVSQAVALVEDEFGPATVFEHGPARAGTPAGCGVDHLHIHVAPLPFSLMAAASNAFPIASWEPVRSPTNVRTLHAAALDYCYVAEPGKPASWAQTPPGIGQFLRRAIATQLGMPERFDYRTHDGRDCVSATLDRLSAWTPPTLKSAQTSSRPAI
jgi:ATP adenylyltransferase